MNGEETEKLRRQRYRVELLTAGMVLGLAMFALLVLQYWTRNLNAILASLFSHAMVVVIVAVQIVYGRRAAALCPPDPAVRPNGFTYGRAFGFAVLTALLSGIVYGAGYFLMVEVVDPHYFGQMIDQGLEHSVSSGLITTEQVAMARGLMHNLGVVIFVNMLGMLLYGGFLALFTSAFVRHRVR